MKIYRRQWQKNPPLDVFASLFAMAYLGWKPPKALEPKGRSGDAPTYQEIMIEFERRMELAQRPRQLEPPAGPSAAEVFAEVERRMHG